MGIIESATDHPGTGATAAEPAETDHPGPATTADLVRRLRRVEGQVRGVQHMLETERDCRDVLTQLSAARKALDQVGFLLVADRLTECATSSDGGLDDERLADLRQMFLRLT